MSGPYCGDGAMALAHLTERWPNHDQRFFLDSERKNMMSSMMGHNPQSKPNTKVPLRLLSEMDMAWSTICTLSTARGEPSVMLNLAIAFCTVTCPLDESALSHAQQPRS